jgi:NAD(P)-dependent dehydrogenase (short-subunit alcohol dehydrogenase family)
MNIDGRTFLITGGSSGLGAACVRRILEAGGRAVVADLKSPEGSEPGARFIQTDITSESEVQHAVEAAVDLSDGDGLRGAINCAGVAAGAKVFDKRGSHALDLFERVLQVNLTGTFNVVRLAAASISETSELDGERGVIVNTSSAAAFDGQIGQAAYAASKGGVASMTLPLARDLAPNGVRVVAIAPGIFDTPMIAGFPDAVRQNLQGNCLFPPRFGHPDEFAAMVEQVVTNPMLNGCVIRLDGGVRMPPR